MWQLLYLCCRMRCYIYSEGKHRPLELSWASRRCEEGRVKRLLWAANPSCFLWGEGRASVGRITARRGLRKCSIRDFKLLTWTSPLHHRFLCMPRVTAAFLAFLLQMLRITFLKAILHTKMRIVMIYLSSSCSKPVWIDFFQWTQKKIFWRMLLVTVDFHSIFIPYCI